MDTHDTFERRDPWRTTWELITSDALLLLLATATFVIGASLIFVPQAPDVVDSTVLNAWRVESKLRLGAWFTPLDIFLLNDVRGSHLLRIVPLGLLALAALRLTDRALRLRDIPAALPGSAARMRVTDAAPDVTHLRAALHARGYRTLESAEELHATRAPSAELLSITLHVGLILSAVGLLINIAFGWDIAGMRLNSDGPVTLHGKTKVQIDAAANTPQKSTLLTEPGGTTWQLGAGESAVNGNLQLTLRRTSPGYRVSAADPNGRMLAIRTSNYLSPTQSAVVDFGGEGSVTIAVPEAGLVVSLLRSPGGGGDQLRAYSVGAAEKIIFAPIEPRMSIGDAQFTFETLAGAEIDASSRPGNPALLLGAGIVVLAALGCTLRPMRRISIRRSGSWTEFYADGRGVRADVRALWQ